MRIAEVSKQFDISADTLRYYERIGLLSHVHRNESGIRDYGEQDLARIPSSSACAAPARLHRGAPRVHGLFEGRRRHPLGARKAIEEGGARRSASAWPRCRRP